MGKVTGVWVPILSHHLSRPYSFFIDGYVHRPEERARQGYSNIIAVHLVMLLGMTKCPFRITKYRDQEKSRKGESGHVN